VGKKTKWKTIAETQGTFVTRMRDFAHLRPTTNATDDDGRLATTTLTTTTTDKNDDQQQRRRATCTGGR